MFNYISVDFPQTTIQPQVVYQADLYQKRYNHEVACLYFKDWGVQYDVVKAGSPVRLVMKGLHEKREFFGYVHHIKVNRTPGKNFTELTVVGASFPMKQQNQAVYTNVTADQVARQIASKHNFVCFSVPQPRVYPQIAQAGHSDWELLVRLAKQSGYSVRATNTELYFVPIMYDYTYYRSEAPRFIMKREGDPTGSTIYSFTPLIGESIPYEDATKGAIAVGGVDYLTAAPISVTQQLRNTKIKTRQQAEFFDIFATDVVAPDPLVASYEADAAEKRTYFPYRGEVTVLGNPMLRPDLPVYLDGIGEPYSGYWTILEAHHNIVEEELNRQRYTTTLIVGADSLGDAVQWKDSKVVTAPEYIPARNIVPNVLQTKILPQTVLNQRVVSENTTNGASFGSPNNRPKPSINGRSNAPAMWQTNTSTLDQVVYETNSPQFIIQRLYKKIGLA